MQPFIIGVTFLLGVACVLVSLVAFLRPGARTAGGSGEQTAGGSLELPGIKLTATSAPALFFVVGAAMVLSGFAWASTNSTKNEAVRGAAQLNDAYVKQVELNRTLTAINPSIVKQLPPDKTELTKAPMVTLSPRLKVEISKLPPQDRISR